MPKTVHDTPAPVCPVESSHGPMSLGDASLTFARGVGKVRFPLDLELRSFPAYVCRACATEGRNTFEPLEEADAAIINGIVKPIKKSLGGSLRSYTFRLPRLILDFGQDGSQSHVPSESSRMPSFKVVRPRFGLERVVLSEESRQSLLRCAALLCKQRLIFEQWGMDSILGGARQFVMNFYGPSGTGKTLTAEALARELGLGFLNVNYSQMESKWVGETPKNIERVFALAEKERALLFFDEADSFLGKRLTRVEQFADYAVNVTRSVMLTAMERFSGTAVFATNLIENYDSAFARRFMLSVVLSGTHRGIHPRQAVGYSSPTRPPP